MTSPLAVWTAGHSNHELEAFVGLLEGADIECLVDVRSFPYSRYAPQFNREELQAAMTERGIRYGFFGEELGGRPKRKDHYDAEGRAPYGRMAAEPEFRTAIQRLLKGASEHRIALVCSEGDPHDCHRRLLVGRVLTAEGVELGTSSPTGASLLSDRWSCRPRLPKARSSLRRNRGDLHNRFHTDDG